ncbi:MAG: pirin family protein [Sphingobacteriaceae bacterium]|nr:MAG: pirin family protein [Sphingobacteriaceae bacterium]
MANTIFHQADSRGHANHGWLDSYHSFSFGSYYNPDRMQFGALRVLNDDAVAGGRGFGSHPHDNMEIISIPLDGDLQHEDNLGNVAVIRKGDVQLISAGTGVFHSEKNKNQHEQVKFLQIWLFPNKLNGAPRYDQVSLDVQDRHNNFQQILSPDPVDSGVWVQQDAWFSLGKFDAGFSTNYQFKKSGNGVYAFVIEGAVTINGQALNSRDGLGIWNTDQLDFTANSAGAEVLLMDVPMSF